MTIGATQTPSRRAIYVMGTDGRRLMTLNASVWGKAAVDRFISASGKQMEAREGVVTLKQLRAEFPQASGWFASSVGGITCLVLVGGATLAIVVPIVIEVIARR